MPPPNNVTLKHCTGSQATAALDAICLLYDTVFSKPPFRWTYDKSEHHRQSLTRLITNPTFTLVTAEAAGELVGFAYGLTLKPDTPWWSGMIEPLPDELTAEWNGRTFAVIDLAVRGDYRKRGIGRALLDALLGSRQEQRATLTVQPVATDTKDYSSANLLKLSKEGACPVAPGRSSQYEKVLKVFSSSGQRRFHSSAAWRWLQPWA